jgi:transposase
VVKKNKKAEETPMKKKYIVDLSEEERERLNKLLSSGNTSVKKYKIAWVLLLADKGFGEGCSDQEIVAKVDISAKTVTRIRQKFFEGGLEKVFEKKFTARLSRRKFKGEEEAHLIALCCSEPPVGHARWTLRLLTERVVELGIVEGICHRTIQQTLKKMKLSLG